MYFESLAEALSMAGHGPYVWSAYGVTVMVLVFLMTAPAARQRRLLRELRGEQRRDARRKEQSSPHTELR